MTDRTQPKAREFNMSQYASKDDMIGAMRKRIAELEAELEAVGAGGVSGPLMGRAALSANAGEPVAWQCRSLRDNGAWFDCTKERFEMRCTQPEIWETRALYAAPPTAQAEGWRPIETAPRDGAELLANTSGLGRVVVYWDDEESQWGTGLGYLDRGAPTHWMPLPPPPTSAGMGERSNPNNCASCRHKQNPDGGHCYMFRFEPTEMCAQHTSQIHARQVLQALRMQFSRRVFEDVIRKQRP